MADDLRALAAAATPGPWELESYTHYDVAPPVTTWSISDLERWRSLTNKVGFGEDEATARYVAAVSPDVVVGLLDEIERLRDELEALADHDPEQDLIEVWVEWDDDTRGWHDTDTLERIPLEGGAG